jgi:hypothetical protein
VERRRSANELRAVDSPAWPEIEQLVRSCAASAQVLSTEEARCDVALEALQVTTGSFLGALVGQCGALLVDGGWLRVLAAGAGGLPGVHEAIPPLDGTRPLLDVAWDVLGGRFAVNGGGLDAEMGEVCYWGPDTLAWTAMGDGHAAFIRWALSDGLGEFYATSRWPGWREDIAPLAPSLGLSVYPPPFTAEGQDLARASRRPVPLLELRAFYEDMAVQLNAHPTDTRFKFKIV